VIRRRNTRRYDLEAPSKVLARGTVLLALMLIGGWLAATLYNGVPGRDYRFVNAVVPQTGSLIPHDPIRIGGVRVGQVRSIGAAPDGMGRIVLQLEPGTGVPRGTKVVLRANGLLGQRFVELLPGRDRTPLAEGEELRGDDASLSYGAADALDVFDRETRGALQPLIRETGIGLTGRGRDVNDLLRVAADEIAPTSALFAELRNPKNGGDQLLPSIGSAMAPLDAQRVAITELIPAGDRALQPFVAERQATRDTLEAAPPALAAADGGLRAARPLLGSARALSAEVLQTLPAATPGLRAAKALLVEARAPIKGANGLVKDIRPTVPSVLQLTKAADPLLKPATGLLGDVTSMTRTLGPYGCDLTNFGAVFRSMTGFGSGGPGGPNGPAMQFRLQAAAPVPEEALGLASTSPLSARDGYPAPCEYPAKPYPIIERPVSLEGNP